MTFNIALDGPSGVGKSSMADALAEMYDLVHLDTGAMYRGAAWYLNSKGLKPEQNTLIEEALKDLDLSFVGDHLIANGQDISDEIRNENISLLASAFAAVPEVRAKLVAAQQKIAENGGYIVDGRDICDVVLPDAPVKIYLDASAEARAKRRYLQLMEKGKPVDYEQVLADIVRRDLQDSTRACSPSGISENAVVVDSTELNKEQTLDALRQVVENTIKE